MYAFPGKLSSRLSVEGTATDADIVVGFDNVYMKKINSWFTSSLSCLPIMVPLWLLLEMNYRAYLYV